MDVSELTGILRDRSDEIRRRFGVGRLAVFGSVARGAAGDGSDVDLLVSFVEVSSFDGFMDLKHYLEDLLGKKVDLVTEKALRPRMRTTIEREAIDVA